MEHIAPCVYACVLVLFGSAHERLANRDQFYQVKRFSCFDFYFFLFRFENEFRYLVRSEMHTNSQSQSKQQRTTENLIYTKYNSRSRSSFLFFSFSFCLFLFCFLQIAPWRDSPAGRAESSTSIDRSIDTTCTHRHQCLLFNCLMPMIERYRRESKFD